jgi:hypothetical protein
MIVRLSNKKSNKEISEFCERLLQIPGTTKKDTPQRCFIRRKSENLASIGMVDKGISIEFRPGKDKYADAHGSSYVKPHANGVLAKEGWLVAKPDNDEQMSQVVEWILNSVR